ncbi:Canalicular multispecific organic anion transporter 2 [Podila epigama]|nr:Canalicular multispecific organic anion transporter 2 [Podila epigama]
MGIDAFCNHEEGWGPTGHGEPDLTLCVEDTILLTLPALVGILGLSYQAYSMWRHGKPHGFGRTNIIYWPSQFFMFASIVSLIARAAVLKNDVYAPATMLSTIAMLLSWCAAIILNYFQHQQHIRSSDYIFGLYFFALVASAINIRTMTLQHMTHQAQFKAFIAFFGFNALGFIVEALPRGRTQAQKKSGAGRYEKANLLSRLTFQFLQPIVSQGYKTPLTAKDIEGMMPEYIKTEYTHARLEKYWKNAVANAQAKGQKPSLVRTIFSAYKTRWIPVMIFRFCASTLTYVSPQLLSRILAFSATYQTDNPAPVSLGIILAFGLFFASMANSFFMAQYFQATMNMGIEVRTALIAMIYRKSLKLSSAAKQKSTAGEISNHMSVDAERWLDGMPFFAMFLSIPYELCICLWMLYNQIGWSVFVGLATIFALLPIQGVIGKLFTKAKSLKLEAMDERIRLMNEILSGIKIVKLYGWEDSFRERVALFRSRELSKLKTIGRAFAFMSIMFSSMPLFVALVSFAVYATVGGPNFTPGDMSPQKVFVSISLFSMLNHPIGMLSHIIALTISVRVASTRIQKFLLAEEILESATESVKALPEDPSVPMVEIKDAVFAWETEGPEVETEKDRKAREKMEEKKQKQLEKEAIKAGKPIPEKPVPVEKNYGPTLTNIDLTIARGNLTAVVGRVGQGKTSLLNAIIGDMYKRQGSVKVYGRMAYVAQQAWIINATLKENILFGNAFDQAKYDHILMACGLLPDIEMLPAGDMTEIGERDADLYLLDDPLSAVDAHVDQHLWHHLIGPNGLLKDKTRVLVTHAIHHLEQSDQIVLIKDGQISETGKYEELMGAQHGFYQLIKDYSVNEGKKRKEKKSNVAGVGAGTENADTSSDVDDDATQDGDDKDAKTVAVHKKDDKAELVAEEQMVLGSVSWDVYKIYCRAASYKYSIMAVLLFVGGQACQIGTNLWLKYWTTPESSGKHPVGLLLGVYALLIISYMIVTVIVSYVVMVLAAIRASTRLHENLLSTMLRLPMSFFDTTPLGRIVNRFSSDVFSTDESLPFNWINVFSCAMSVLGTIVVIATTTPIFLAMVPPLVVVYLLVQAYYIRASRALKRVDSVSKSPIYQHFSESLSGVTTIRALGAERRFIEENAKRANIAGNAYFSWVVSNRWLQIRLEGLGAVIVLAAALFVVLSRNTLSPQAIGLSLTYALSVTGDITWLVRSYCDLQNQLVAVERMNEYATKNQEAPAETDVKLPENWPQAGHVEFRNYSTRYREGLDLVIKDISFEVQPGEKVGIVGRTGTGKSSLTLALFRIVEAANSVWAKASHNGADLDSDPTKKDEVADLEKVDVEEDGGSIWIDGIDISTVGLKYLRQHLAIIPQDPTLFIGTVRENLDPFNELQDADLWEALERAHLKEHIASLAGGLSFKVTQNGDNFSVGQRSLICLARALLRKTKILVLDEATAAVDVETDELIQKTIRKEFADRTILTIAHRIKTVMDSDKILVLEKGRVEEFESPSVLLQRPDSLFYKLAQQAGEIKDSDE